MFFGLRRYGPRALGVGLLVVLVPLFVLRIARTDRRRLSHVAFVPLLVVALVGAASLLGRAGLMLFVPTVVNAVLAVTFAATLGSELPMIERFARLQDPDLTDAEVAWCRLWTKVWIGYFAVSAVIVSALAAADLRSWWVVYTGLIAYVCIGVLFAVEYVMRKARFGRLRTHPLDRGLGWLFARLGRAPDSDGAP